MKREDIGQMAHDIIERCVADKRGTYKISEEGR